MNNLKLDDNTARQIYPTAIPALKTIMEQSFPKGFFSMSIIDRTPTVEAALWIAGKTLNDLQKPGDTKHEFAGRVIETVIEILWDGVKVDHSNSDQVKYEPRFKYRSGFGLSYDGYVRWDTGTRCGPRLCYPDYNRMIHGVKILDKFYNDYLN